MIQDSASIDYRHKQFIKRITKTKIVYALNNKKDYATSSSNNFEDKEGNPYTIICFWSSKALANSCIKNEWKKYKVVEISLASFLENWCIGMHQDNLIVGTDFNQNMFGYEGKPQDIALEIISNINLDNDYIALKRFSNLSELKEKIETI